MFAKITRKKLEVFLKKYATTEKILDVGSGGSSYHTLFPNRLAVDIDPDRKPDIVADAHHLPFTDNEFNFVLSTEMLEHTVDPKQVVAELIRVLKPGGTLVLTTRFVYPLHDCPHDYWRFTKYNLLQLFESTEILELQAETKSFSALGALIQRLAFQGRFKGGRFTTFLLLILASILSKCDWLITQEFGDIKKSVAEKDILTTGYYIAVKKRA